MFDEVGRSPKSQSANETITTIANFALKVIGIPIRSIHE